MLNSNIKIGFMDSLIYLNNALFTAIRSKKYIFFLVIIQAYVAILHLTGWHAWDTKSMAKYFTYAWNTFLGSFQAFYDAWKNVWWALTKCFDAGSKELQFGKKADKTVPWNQIEDIFILCQRLFFIDLLELLQLFQRWKLCKIT